MTCIIVNRGNADKQGDDIVDPVLCSTKLALSRGRAELDDHELTNTVEVTTQLSNVLLGQLVRIQSYIMGSYTGKVTALSHRCVMDDNGVLQGETKLTLKVKR